MIDVNILRNDFDAVKKMLTDRGSSIDLTAFSDLDSKRRQLITDSDKLKSERKSTSKQIGMMIGKGEDPAEIKARVAKMGDRIKEMDSELAQTEEELNDLLAGIPNILHDTTPIGAGEDDNVEVDRWGTPRDFGFEIKDHVDLGTALNILDFETAAKLTGARFALLRGDGARLERALINFMIDVHTEQGYEEVLPPFIVNGDSMYGTGQFPKMKEDVFKLEGLNYYLIPTAEVPVTNIHRNEFIEEARLPVYYQAFTPCFRSEAGAHGRDTRGLIRQHQFNKVELVKFVHPEESDKELEKLRNDAEEILKRLELPYRVMALCSGDISFAAAKCYDLEVWLPGQGKYREISSCSNFRDFQARRARIRYKGGKKKGLVHTLNGSGLAVGRTLVALLENHQQSDGSIQIPEALRPYMNGKETISK
ncbi:MAG: serine--tRNA ligase [Acidobacteriota bacterium]|nr:serine--tRNA ligase [Acidobacteriota bacterium]